MGCGASAHNKVIAAHEGNDMIPTIVQVKSPLSPNKEFQDNTIVPTVVDNQRSGSKGTENIFSDIHQPKDGMSRQTSNKSNARVKVSEQVRQLFESLDIDGSEKVKVSFLVELLEHKGLSRCDPRLRTFFEETDTLGPNHFLSLIEFNVAIADCFSLVHEALSGGLRVPGFHKLKEIVKDVFEKVLPNKGGANANYIPQLAKVDPEQFAISITTCDGQHFSIGDADTQFCIQSCSKPISYLMALDKFGEKFVHHHVGTEPSGRPFNEMVLKKAPTEENPDRQIPHNPCINAGAIMTVSMIEPSINCGQTRLETVMNTWRDLSAAQGFTKDPIGFDHDTYKSESGSANRNWCLSYMMLERGAFPDCFYRHTEDRQNLSDTLELYFQLCSILSTNRAMSVMAATLANGGLNPWTEKKVTSAKNVRCVLPVMLSSGMYDYSGQWAYEVGVPAKSGVGGCVFMVVPNVCGISVWSPRLNAEGNSVRAVAVASELVKKCQLHGFEVFAGGTGKMDPKRDEHAEQDSYVAHVLLAASLGDIQSFKKFDQSGGYDYYQSDYDGRTALHLAAMEGHHLCVKFLVDRMPRDQKHMLVNVEDRWKRTPLDDAESKENDACVKILFAAGAKNGHCTMVPPLYPRQPNPSDDGPDLIAAAARGSLCKLIEQRCKGSDFSLDHHDYDLRTPLHLAASNGHLACVKYIYVQTAVCDDTARLLTSVDRWGNTAFDDAKRGNHKECLQYLTPLMPSNEKKKKPMLSRRYTARFGGVYIDDAAAAAAALVGPNVGA